ncbi:MAG: cytochrome c oxidase accessory protein CcoG [Rhodobacterales bacterium]|nr:MAG: cytochrome c oxidase accessory protein CcoG [Rhodobacterales bacterium]
MSNTEQKTPKLYAAREPVFPKKVKGKFRQLKWGILIVALGVYYIGPWLRWDRGPNLPDQAILIDLAGRRFFFFMIEIWPHEFYFIAGLLIMAGLGLFLFTSALGRVWCGYACPQTVWTDLFILTERWIEGDRNARVRLWKSKWDAKKWRLRLFKWFVWLLIGLATGGAWVFYFADAPTLFVDLVTGNAHPIAYPTVLIMTVMTVLFGGFAREQICIYMCPWPRIQSAMMDEDTLLVGYRHWRGEPRGRRRKRGAPQDELGDCIDCRACVNVCPTGIDIRNGPQLECITCALCIDACDEMMEKVGKPRGLIDYLAFSDEGREVSGQPPRPVWRHIFRPRTIMYTTLWSAIGVGLLVALLIRPDIDMTVAPVRNPQFVTLSDGTIRNTYNVRLRNKHGDDRTFKFTISDDTLSFRLEGQEGESVIVPSDKTLLQRVYVTAPKRSKAAKSARTDFTMQVEDTTSQETSSASTVFNGRGR